MKLDAKRLKAEAEGHEERMKGPLWSPVDSRGPDEPIIRMYALFALEDLQNELDRQLVPLGVSKARIHSLLNRHHERLIGIIVAAVQTALAGNAKGVPAQVPIVESDVAKVQEAIEDGWPFRMIFAVPEGQTVSVEVIVDVDGLAVALPSGGEWKTESEEAAALVAALPTQIPKLSGARLVKVERVNDDE